MTLRSRTVPPPCPPLTEVVSFRQIRPGEASEVLDALLEKERRPKLALLAEGVPLLLQRELQTSPVDQRSTLVCLRESSVRPSRTR